MHEPVIDFSGEADFPMAKPGRRSFGASSAPCDPKWNPHIRHLDHVRGVFMCPDAVALVSPQPTLRDPWRPDLGVMKEAP
jgi:hypothetical protein